MRRLAGSSLVRLASLGAVAALSATCGPVNVTVSSSPPPRPPVANPVDAAPPPAPLVPPGLRLPRDLVVSGYDLTLSVDPTRTTSTGTMIITGHVVRPTAVVWLHGEDLTVSAVEVAGAGGAVSAEAVMGLARGQFAVRTVAPLPVGPATITLRFTAQITDQASRGTFRQAVGDDWYVFTHHEPLAARRSFPCVDEPDVKVPWQLTLDVPAGLTAVANAPVAEQRTAAGRTSYRFAPTLPLPSYLVAFAVGPFDVVDAGTSAGGAPIRIIAPRGRAADAAFAVGATPRILAALEDWFGSRYPFAKLDSIAVPSTVGFGAMENPGLITYRESLLLIPSDAPDGRRRRYAAVAAHELAHQWFGDLVTPVWWDDLWLNESFASWVPSHVVDKLYPGWATASDRVESREWALHADSLATARRIHQPIEDEGDIVNAFDGITYGKGSAVLTMMESWVGPERFQAGVRAYLVAHARGNATAADFVAAIAAQAPDLDVTGAFNSFLDQAGAPRIGATVECRGRGGPGRGNRGRIHLRQSRFVPLGSASAQATRWMVPVCLRAGVRGRVQQVCTVLTDEEATVEVSGCPKWVWPNADANGYYRVGLDHAGWDALRRHGWRQLSDAERLAAAFDLRAAVASNEVGIDAILDLIPLLLRDGDRAGIGLAANQAASIESWVPEARLPAYRKWIRRRFGRLATRLGWAPGRRDDLDHQRMRQAVVPLVANEGRDPRLARDAVVRARRWRSLPEAGRGALLQVAVRTQPSLHDDFLAGLETVTDRQLRLDLAGALGSVPDQERMNKALALAAKPGFDLNEVRAMVETAISRFDTRPLAQAFLTQNLDALIARLPGDLPAALIDVLGVGCDADAIAPTRKLLEDKLGKYRGAPRRIDQVLESVAQCAARKAAAAPVLDAWLARVR